MTILGVGTDIIEIARIKEVIANSGDRLARRILNNNEWLVWETHNQKTRFLAKCFAVKEAASKAFGTGICNGLAFNQFEMTHDDLGKPYLKLWGKAKLLSKQLGIDQLCISLSDERCYVFATVIIETQRPLICR